jgi:hypothetical protein
MYGSVPLLPQYAFVAWCSVKAQAQLNLTLPYRLMFHVSFSELVGRIEGYRSGWNSYGVFIVQLKNEWTGQTMYMLYS